MEKIIKYLKGIHWLVYLILFFCAIGLLRNTYQLFIFRLGYGSMITKIFLAMMVIYASQIILIIAREPKVWIISLIQALFCLYVYEDFTFLPVTTAVKSIIFYLSPQMGYGWVNFISVTAVSALFSLELLKTYILYALTEPVQSARPKKRVYRKKAEPKPEPTL